MAVIEQIAVMSDECLRRANNVHHAGEVHSRLCANTGPQRDSILTEGGGYRGVKSSNVALLVDRQGAFPAFFSRSSVEIETLGYSRASLRDGH